MDRIDLLESKIKQMIDLVQSLREENQGLRDRLSAAESRSREMSQEREVLDRERDQVRDRIEQLLGDLAEVERTRGGGAGGDLPREADAGAERPSDPGTQAAPHPNNPVLPGLA